MNAQPYEELYRRAWKHIELEEFARAETVLRQLIDLTDPGDSTRLWGLYGLLAGVLNSLSRPAEGTELYRRALVEARRAGEAHPTVAPARFMLANQLLVFGDPQEALAETDPVPAGAGHVQCLLHFVAAQALWKLGRSEEAKSAAQLAIETAPTPSVAQKLRKAWKTF